MYKNQLQIYQTKIKYKFLTFNIDYKTPFPVRGPFRKKIFLKNSEEKQTKFVLQGKICKAQLHPDPIYTNKPITQQELSQFKWDSANPGVLGAKRLASVARKLMPGGEGSAGIKTNNGEIIF